MRRSLTKAKRRVRTLVSKKARRHEATRYALSSRYLHGSGLEIGALHMPLKVPRGAQVRYVDRMSVTDLREQYPELAELDLVAVDVVDDGETLATVAPSSQDFIIANHFLEHTQSPISTLESHLRVLRPGGVLYMAIPDKRETFDRSRPLTTLEHVLRDHAEGPAWSRRQHFEEWAEHVSVVLNDIPSAEWPAEAARLEEMDYSIHFHVWTPETLLAMLLHCRDALGFPIELEATQRNNHEFIVVLRKAAAEPAAVPSDQEPTTVLPRPLRKLGPWAGEVKVYWRESATPADFARLMRVRLAQSKVGRFVTPSPITVDVDLKLLGPSVRLRSHTTDISVLKEILVGDTYTPLPPDPSVTTVIDLGANVGLSFRWLRTRYPNAHFICVEPEPGNVEILRANVRAVDQSAEIHAACVGGRERRVALSSTQGEWGFRMADDDGADIDVITMESILSGSGVDRIGILKCDIEGAEAEVFADCHSWIDRVDAMSVECHSDVITTDALLTAISDGGGRFDVRHLESNPHLGFDIVTLQRSAA